MKLGESFALFRSWLLTSVKPTLETRLPFGVLHRIRSMFSQLSAIECRAFVRGAIPNRRAWPTLEARKKRVDLHVIPWH